MISKSVRWFSRGLHFSCEQCGYCCIGSPGGYVWLGSDEEEKIARHLGISQEELRKKYLKMCGKHYSLIVHPSGECIFYDEGCLIYPARPFQCSSFPFWPHIVQASHSWDTRSENCPGMNRGKLHSFDDIMRILLKYREIYK